MNYDIIAQEVLELLGGKGNVNSNATCMTRLRVNVKDQGLVNVEGLKKVDGVLGVVEADTIQIIFGPGKVNKAGESFSKLSGLAIGAGSNDDINDIASENKKANNAKHDGPVQVFLRRIAAVFIPLLPAIIAAGLINGLTNVINVSTEGAYNSMWWYQLIRTLGWAVFAYLPIFVGMNAAKEMKGTPILGAVAGALATSNVAMPLLMNIGLPDGDPKSILMPFTNAAYNPAAGGMIAALIAGFIFAILERQIRKIMPEILDTFFTPLLTLIIGGFLMVIVFQPAGKFISDFIFNGMNFLYNDLGVFGGYLLSASFLPLVSVGLHQALTPIHQLLNNPEGATKGINYLLPILMMAGGGQVGAALALYVKTKNLRLKKLIKNAIPVGILGVGEPLMYAVTLPLGRSFLTACLGSGIGGVMAVIFHLGTISQGVSGLFGLLIVQPGQQLQFAIAMLFAYAGGFLLTYFFGVDEERINQVYGE